MTWAMSAMTAAVGLLLALVPTISRPTVPLGVSIPRSRIDDEAVLRAITRYRVCCVILTAASLLGLWLTRRSPELGALWMLILIIAAMVAFAICRVPIQRAKREQGWFDTVRTSPAESQPAPAPVSPVWPLHLLSTGLALASCITVAVVAPGLLGAALSALGTAVLLAVLSWWVSRRRDPVPPDGDRPRARTASLEIAVAVQIGIAGLSLVTTLVTIALAVLPVLQLSPQALGVATWTGAIAVLVPAVWMVAAAARAQGHARAGGRVGRPGDPDTVDDDQLWKLGLIYYNPADSSVMVPKRNGVGLEPNAGHPIGMAIYLFALIVIIAAFAMVLLPL